MATLYILSSLFIIFACILIADASKVKKLESYSDASAFVCISIPLPGETFQTKGPASTPPTVEAIKTLNFQYETFPKASTIIPDRQLAEESLDETDEEKSVDNRLDVVENAIQKIWTLTRPDDMQVLTNSLQYFVKSNSTGMLSWAGQTMIPVELLTTGPHTLTYEQTVVEVNRLSLTVWWDSQELVFHPNEDKLFTHTDFVPHQVVLYGTTPLQESAHAMCYDDNAAAVIVPDFSGTAAVAIVASSIIIFFLISGIVMMVVLNRCCKTGRFSGYKTVRAADVQPVEWGAVPNTSELERENRAYQIINSE